jgi:hypothetical protein
LVFIIFLVVVVVIIIIIIIVVIIIIIVVVIVIIIIIITLSRISGFVARSCLNITTQKPLSWTSCIPFPCRLIFHNSLQDSGPVHSTNLYPLIVTGVELSKKKKKRRGFKFF